MAGPLQQMTDGRLDASILRQLMIALAMIGVMLLRPRGLWPSPEHGEASVPDGASSLHPAAVEQIPPAVTGIAPTGMTPRESNRPRRSDRSQRSDRR